VIIKPISNGPSRVAALLAGDVDLIDQVPPTDIALLKKNDKITVSQAPSLQIMLLNLAQQPDKWPYITAVDGSALPENPLMKWEVRKAISLAINREGNAARTMEGSAVPVGQMVPEGFYGYNPALKPDPFDPKRARELLRKAGYPNGFSITLHGPNNRYINDEKIVQAIAQMLNRIGIRTSVETMPVSVFFARANKREFSLFLTGNGGVTGESSSVLRTLFHSYDAAGGHGTMNRGRYNNTKFDSMLQLAMKTIDDAKREQLLKNAMEIGINDLGLIPLHAEVYTWATRRGLKYLPRTDTYTLAMSVRSE
jgi:peptide/nickel transport system substrate-binding protein